jgi:hypothetical protein
MKWMQGWSWDDYQSAPDALVARIMELMEDNVRQVERQARRNKRR